MSTYLDNLSTIPQCSQLRGWLYGLNKKANEQRGIMASDDSFTEEEFEYV